MSTRYPIATPSASSSTSASTSASSFRLSCVADASRCLVLCAVLGAAMSGQALAADEKKDGEAQQLDTVVVTAQKRSESIKDVPMSVEVVDTEKLASQGMVKLADFYTQVPGLTLVQSATSGAIMMRGIGTTAGIGIRPTAGVVVDDVAYGSAANTSVIPDLDPSDLRQIEVLRGPQGTLYGASSMGGLIKYVLNDADTRRATRRVEIGASDTRHGTDGYVARFSLNQPITDDIAVRLSGFKRRDAGFVHNVNDPDEDGETRVSGARFAALWRVNDRLSLRLSTITQSTRTTSSNVEDVNYSLQPVDEAYSHSRAVGNDNFHGRSSVSTLKLTADLGFATLDAITGYNDHLQGANQDVSYTAIGSVAPFIAAAMGIDLENPGAAIVNRYNSNTTTQEVRLSSKDGAPVEWLVGGYYSKENVHSVQDFYLAETLEHYVVPNPPLLTSEGGSHYTTKAVFGDVTYKFTPKFDVQLGLRRAQGKNSSAGEAGGALADAQTYSEANKDNNTTYLFSPRYKFSKDLMAYFRAASGYRPGGSNGEIPGSTIPTSFKSDKLNSYELGAKATLREYGLSLDAALFRIDWSDLQLSQYDLTYGSSYTINGGKARSDGVELSGVWTPNMDWKLTASYAYNNARLAQDIPGFIEGSSAYGKNGDRLPYSAKNTLALSATRTFTVAGSYDCFAGVNYNYVGSRQMEFEQSSTLPRISLPSYSTVGLNLGVSTDRWTLTLYGRNLTDEKAYTNASRRAASLASGTSATIGATLVQPATVGFTLAWNI
ncbi:Outer membrane receptor proteins, mostly Fe transport [Roseateles sp. YR242]|uniref:TonB-dependent receptor n=1 Tax=Roseateles sp. YR242 TaxID=1855305 RepID=UPI0008ABB75D|nr:TonB-dependent receptor [Roseateles sp. YR242]SEK87565.1 Outer membrane receptor proteins, mostly Fe transport [Roseateles sp. YR242]